VLEVQATLVNGGKRFPVPMYGGESLDHALFKISIAAHLVSWGYHWEQIYWETTPLQLPEDFRPDLYVKGHADLPSFWFECGGTRQEKLLAVVAAFPGLRIVRVLDDDSFGRLWSGESMYLTGDDGKLIRLEGVEGWQERRTLVLRQRESITPPGVECWAIRARERFPRIVWAVRREHDGRFTYLDTGEGWSLSSFRYISKRKDGFQPMIPGVVGDERWTGQSQGYIDKEQESNAG
jgi:hypothetical protein